MSTKVIHRNHREQSRPTATLPEKSLTKKGATLARPPDALVWRAPPWPAGGIGGGPTTAAKRVAARRSRLRGLPLHTCSSKATASAGHPSLREGGHEGSGGRDPSALRRLSTPSRTWMRGTRAGTDNGMPRSCGPAAYRCRTRASAGCWPMCGGTSLSAAGVEHTIMWCIPTAP